MFAYCGLVGNPHLTVFFFFNCLLPFQRQPSHGHGIPWKHLLTMAHIELAPARGLRLAPAAAVLLLRLLLHPHPQVLQVLSGSDRWGGAGLLGWGGAVGVGLLGVGLGFFHGLDAFDDQTLSPTLQVSPYWCHGLCRGYMGNHPQPPVRQSQQPLGGKLNV